MKRILLLFGSTLLSFHSSNAQNNGPANIMVLRVGDGMNALTNTGNMAFIDEYDAIGNYINFYTMPFTPSGSNNRLILNGTATSEGMIRRSVNGMYITLAGYNRALGQIGSLSLTSSATVGRTIGTLDASGTINTSTVLTDLADGGSPRAVISTDGAHLWAGGGTSGLRYFTLGATTSTLISSDLDNIRTLDIADNSLVISASSGAYRLAKISTGGLPTTGGFPINNISGSPTTGSPYQFQYFDLDASVAGPDVLYVADDAAGIQKYSLVGGNWVLNSTTGSGANAYRGLTGYRDPATGYIYLYAVANGTALVKLTDTRGYNQAFTGITTTMINADVNTAFRGVALAPTTAPLPLGLLSFSASKTNTANVIAWTTNDELNAAGYEVERSTNGVQFSKLTYVTAKGSQLYNAYTVNDATNASEVYYRLRMVMKDGRSQYSKTVRIFSKSGGKFTVWPNPVTSGPVTVQHAEAGYNATIGIFTTDGRMMLRYPVQQGSVQTSLHAGDLPKGSYLLVYTNGGNVQTEKLLKY